MAVAVAVAVAVSGGGAVAVAVAGLTKRFFNHIQKDFLINAWGWNLQDWKGWIRGIVPGRKFLLQKYYDFAY